MKNIFTREVKIALVAIVGLVLLFFGMNFLKGLSLFSNTSTYLLTFSDAKGLTNSTAIYANGYRVGSVTDIDYDYSRPGRIVVTAGLNPDLRIPAGSTATIETDLMGNLKVSLLLASNQSERVQPGDTIPGAEDKELMAAMGAMLPTVEAMLPKLDSIVSALNRLLSDPAIANTLHNTESMTANLKQSTAQLNTMMAQVNGQLPTMMDHANNTMANAEQLTAKLNTLDINSTMASVDRTLENVEKLTQTLNSNEGTLGLLMNDAQLYNNLTAMTGDVDSLMIDLKAHPKRYVHFSLFGKKDK